MNARALLVQASQARNTLFALKDRFQARANVTRGSIHYECLVKVIQVRSDIVLATDNMEKLMAITTSDKGAKS